jgi:phenol 2-monooxygenase
MNVSMQDSFNLGWKIGGVLNGHLPRSILKTYETERRPLAQGLIDLDRSLSNVLSGKPNPGEVERGYAEVRKFSSTNGLCYPPSSLVSAANGHQLLAANLEPGRRFLGYQIMRQSNTAIWESQVS